MELRISQSSFDDVASSSKSRRICASDTFVKQLRRRSPARVYRRRFIRSRVVRSYLCWADSRRSLHWLCVMESPRSQPQLSATDILAQLHEERDRRTRAEAVLANERSRRLNLEGRLHRERESSKLAMDASAASHSRSTASLLPPTTGRAPGTPPREAAPPSVVQAVSPLAAAMGATGATGSSFVFPADTHSTAEASAAARANVAALQQDDERLKRARQEYDALDLSALPPDAAATYPQRRGGARHQPAGSAAPLDPAHPAAQQAIAAVQEAGHQLLAATTARASIDVDAGGDAQVQHYAGVVSAAQGAVREAAAALAAVPEAVNPRQQQRWRAALAQHAAVREVAAALSTRNQADGAPPDVASAALQDALAAVAEADAWFSRAGEAGSDALTPDHEAALERARAACAAATRALDRRPDPPSALAGGLQVEADAEPPRPAARQAPRPPPLPLQQTLTPTYSAPVLRAGDAGGSLAAAQAQAQAQRQARARTLQQQQQQLYPAADSEYSVALTERARPSVTSRTLGARRGPSALPDPSLSARASPFMANQSMPAPVLRAAVRAASTAARSQRGLVSQQLQLEGGVPPVDPAAVAAMSPAQLVAVLQRYREVRAGGGKQLIRGVRGRGRPALFARVNRSAPPLAARRDGRAHLRGTAGVRDDA